MIRGRDGGYLILSFIGAKGVAEDAGEGRFHSRTGFDVDLERLIVDVSRLISGAGQGHAGGIQGIQGNLEFSCIPSLLPSAEHGARVSDNIPGAPESQLAVSLERLPCTRAHSTFGSIRSFERSDVSQRLFAPILPGTIKTHAPPWDKGRLSSADDIGVPCVASF